MAYEYLPVPTAAALLPDAFGPTAGGDVVTIVGTGFVAGATSVQIGPNTIPASQVSVVGGGQTPLTGALTQALQASLRAIADRDRHERDLHHPGATSPGRWRSP